MAARTYLQPEEYAYPDGGQARRGLAVWPDGARRRVYAGIADTVWTVPAHGRIAGRYIAGFLTVAGWLDAERYGVAEGEYLFHPMARYGLAEREIVTADPS